MKLDRVVYILIIFLLMAVIVYPISAQTVTIETPTEMINIYGISMNVEVYNKTIHANTFGNTSFDKLIYWSRCKVEIV